MPKILESDARVFMTPREQGLKKVLVSLLTDDGNGHKYPKYAARLDDFIIKIIDDDDLCPTAQVSFSTGVIEINHGFVELSGSKDKALKQLSVLVRHEMAHNLLMHQIRMMHVWNSKFGKDAEESLNYSQTLHSLLNVIEDFEISNTRYTDEDKNTVRHMTLNGKVISGLVTEDHRSSWQTLSLEEMYQKLEDETKTIHQNLLQMLKNNLVSSTDQVEIEVINTAKYANVNSKPYFTGKVSEFLLNRCAYNFSAFDSKKPCMVIMSSLPDAWQNLVTKVYNNFNTKTVTKQDILNAVEEIAKAPILTKYNLKTPDGKAVATLITPEEKLLASDILKGLVYCNSDYDIWYNKIINALERPLYSKEDLETIRDAISKLSNTAKETTNG